MILVDLQKVGAFRPDRPLFEDLSLTVQTGDRLGVVGRNGSGKSTLLSLLAGASAPERGEVRVGRGTRIGYLGQRAHIQAPTVREAVGEHWEAAAILEHLGMGPLADAEVANLSGGQAKRVALARLLVDEVDLLVLDEPTNHLDVEAIAWLESRLARFRGGLVMVTHDRHVLDRVTTRVLELDRGRGYVHEGGYETYLEARVERAEREAGAERVRKNLAKAELAWLRRGAPARTAKPKARIASAKAIVEGRGPTADRPEPLQLDAAGAGEPTPRLGDKVVELTGVGHRFGDNPWLFSGLDLSLDPAGRLGIVGPNGSGKSTLLEILAGRIVPEVGQVETGVTVKLGYYDQGGTGLDPAQRVREAVSGDARQPDWHQARLMEQFWFDNDAQWAPIGTLSGGERRRLQLLLVLAGRPNVLLLDEPTNDLDLDTLRVLEEYLETWAGSVVIVSHDRALLERSVEDVLVLDGTGGASTPPGGYAEYERSRHLVAASGPKGLSAASTPPAAPGATDTAPPKPDRTAKARKPRSASTLRRLISLVEAEMETSSQAIADLTGRLSSAGSDHVELAAIAAELAEQQQRLAEAEERWLSLSEELGG